MQDWRLDTSTHFALSYFVRKMDIFKQGASFGTPMNKTITKALTLIGLFVALYVVASVLATFTQLAASADRIYQGAGQPVFWTLLVAFTGLLLYPLVLLLQMPKAMRPPHDKSEPAYSQYRNWLRQHLSDSKRTDIETLLQENNVEGALDVLNREADLLVRNTAGGVFVSTAMIQNGRLDGLVMLASQLRLVWKVASLYNLRPSPRQLWYLYSNVGGTMLLSTNLEDVNFAELASPIVNSVAPSLVSAVPGLQGIGNLLVNSLANGSANAFLTLRVGLIAKAYCAPLVEPDPREVRKSATIAALALLRDIAKENGSAVAKGVWSGVTGVVGKTASSAVAGTKRAAALTADAVTSAAEVTVSALGSAGTMAKDAAITTAEFVQANTGKLSGAVAGAGKVVANASLAAADMAVDGANAVTSGSSKLGGAIGKATVSATKQTVEAVSKAGGFAADTAVKASKSVSAGVVQGVKKSGTAIAGAADSVVSNTSHAVQSTTQFFSKKPKSDEKLVEDSHPDPS